ncbi:MAG: 4a-hydroxytetrahydrobiopterin dehydratase [Minisyncoccota bacterium]
MTDTPLLQQKCQVCEVGAPPMTQTDIEKHLHEVPQWKQKENKIERTFTFADFKESMKFVNNVANLAEAEGHHPDIAIAYSKVTITLWTHAVGGLSLNDFILAAKIDKAG